MDEAEPDLDEDLQVMIARELATSAQHLVESREEFKQQMLAALDALEGIATYLEKFAKSEDSRGELLAARMTLHESVLDMLGTLKDVVSENTVALNENTERLNKFLTKFETYFGTDRGLELEN